MRLHTYIHTDIRSTKRSYRWHVKVRLLYYCYHDYTTTTTHHPLPLSIDSHWLHLRRHYIYCRPNALPNPYNPYNPSQPRRSRHPGVWVGGLGRSTVRDRNSPTADRYTQTYQPPYLIPRHTQYPIPIHTRNYYQASTVQCYRVVRGK